MRRPWTSAQSHGDERQHQRAQDALGQGFGAWLFPSRSRATFVLLRWRLTPMRWSTMVNSVILLGLGASAWGGHHGTRWVLNVSDREGAAGTLMAITEYACSPLP